MWEHRARRHYHSLTLDAQPAAPRGPFAVSLRHPSRQKALCSLGVPADKASAPSASRAWGGLSVRAGGLPAAQGRLPAFSCAGPVYTRCCFLGERVPHCPPYNYLEVGVGVGIRQPGGARVLLVLEGPVEGLGDGAQVEDAHGRGGDAVPGGPGKREGVRSDSPARALHGAGSLQRPQDHHLPTPQG